MSVAQRLRNLDSPNSVPDTVLRKSQTPADSASRVDTIRMMPIFQLKKLRLRKGDLHRFTELVSGQEEFHCTIIPQSWSRNIADPKVTGFEYHPNTASKQSLGQGASPRLHA